MPKGVYIKTIIQKNRISETLKKLFKEGKLIPNMKGKNLLESHKKNISISLKRLYKEGKMKPYWQGKKKRVLTEEHKKKISLGNSGKKFSKERKERISGGLTDRKLSEKHRERIRENHWTKNLEIRDEIIKKINTQERSKKISKKNKGKQRTKKNKKRISISLKKLWKNEKFAKEMLKASRKAMAIKPNKPEKIMIDLIQKNNLPFNYVGDGAIWFRGKNHSFNPDFLSKNPKHIIEVFGDYWHNREDAKKRDKERLSTYSRYGYKTLIIWEHELKNPKLALNNVRKFLNDNRFN